MERVLGLEDARFQRVRRRREWLSPVLVLILACLAVQGGNKREVSIGETDHQLQVLVVECGEEVAWFGLLLLRVGRDGVGQGELGVFVP